MTALGRSQSFEHNDRRKVTFQSFKNSSPPHPPPSIPLSSSLMTEFINLFQIPEAPKLAKIIEPEPFSRVTPGYDMRTLRKQIEQLRQEILNHVEVQGIIYNQNEVLWNYLKDLVRSNETNSQILEFQILKFSDEFKRLSLERAQQADELRDLKLKSEEIEIFQIEQQRLENVLVKIKEKKSSALLEYERYG
jgi:hypothetical protein